MVLGRIDGAPAGVKGISLFVVPKYLVNPDGSLGARNDVRCLSIEHKLGIHASPTCVLAFGEKDGAVAYRVGEAGRGLEYMFIMMNSARLSVGSEGYAVGERAFQRAAEWARTRVQGKPPVAQPAGPAPIIEHPDVKRMLLLMKSQTEASRALALYAALQLDLAQYAADETARGAALGRGELLIPIVKGWCTEIGNEVAGLGVQVHGGMGFIEETGAAQYVRDVRITTIYEGTTGIQSLDLIGRKLGRDRGAAMQAPADGHGARAAGTGGHGGRRRCRPRRCAGAPWRSCAPPPRRCCRCWPRGRTSAWVSPCRISSCAATSSAAGCWRSPRPSPRPRATAPTARSMPPR